jgi:creatinine amidohydrolase
MRPGQWEAAARKFPVVYVPFGLIEWHGRHLPLGTDALKAHAILVRCAEEFGGVVYPPVYFPSLAWNNGAIREDQMDRVLIVRQLFERLKLAGFRVIIGVSGHNIKEQVLMINKALEPVIEDGTITGGGFWEFDLAESDEAKSDHAAKWETSDMLYFYPQYVDISALGDQPLAPRMKPPDGIGGDDPRVHASCEVGRRKAELCAKALGKKARELLESLPPEHRQFRLETIAPGHWWDI